MPAISRFNATAARAFGFSAGVSNPPLTVEALIIAGGGGGAGGSGGGGGAGGYYENLSAAIVRQTVYTLIVGAGGAAQTNSIQRGNTGGSSTFTAARATAVSGGSGGASTFYDANNSNGSGGGGAVKVEWGTTNKVVWDFGTGGNSGITGNDGGDATNGVPSNVTAIADVGFFLNGGGGGGAGAVGSNPTFTLVGSTYTFNLGSGGVGLQNSITGVSTYYAGGGAGNAYKNVPSGYTANYNDGSGGLGGGGGPSTAGTANTGGGGGAGGTSGSTGAAGGSGVVIIAYPDNYDDPVVIGVTYTKSTVSRAGYKVFTFTSGSGSIYWK